MSPASNPKLYPMQNYFIIAYKLKLLHKMHRRYFLSVIHKEIMIIGTITDI